MDTMIEKKRATVMSEALFPEEREFIKSICDENSEEVLATFESQLQALKEGVCEVEGFLSICEQIFPIERYREYYFLAEEINQYVEAWNLGTEQLFPTLGVVRSYLPPVQLFVSYLQEICVLHVVAADTYYSLTESDIVSVANDTDVFFPDEYLPIDGATRTSLSEYVKVAVVDSGLDVSHPDLQHVGEDHCLDFSGDRFPFDSIGHGTHCAGIINGRGVQNSQCTGIAPGAELYSLKVFKDNHAAVVNILNALSWGIDHEITIFNLSLGVETPKALMPMDFLAHLIERLIHQYNLLIIVSAGNEGCRKNGSIVMNSITSPGTCPSALTVGAVTKDGLLASFSSRGSVKKSSPCYGKPNLCAPGVRVVSCCASSLKSSDSYIVYSGTSMATPFITGLVCLMVGSGLDRDEIFAVFSDVCEVPLNREGTPYSSIFEVGWGTVNTTVLARRLSSDNYKAAGSLCFKSIRCDWSGIPLPREGSVGQEYYACCDDHSKYISTKAYTRYRGEVDDQKLSKDALLQYWVVRREHIHKREMAIRIFAENAKRLSLTEALTVQYAEEQVPSFLRSDFKTCEVFRIPLSASLLLPKVKHRFCNDLLYVQQLVLCFEAHQQLFEDEGKRCIAFLDHKNQIPPVTQADYRWCTVEEQKDEKCVRWTIKDASFLGTDTLGKLLYDVFWLEPFEDRVIRCASQLDQICRSLNRLSLPPAAVQKVVATYGVDFLLTSKVPGFLVSLHQQKLDIRRAG